MNKVKKSFALDGVVYEALKKQAEYEGLSLSSWLNRHLKQVLINEAKTDKDKK